MRISKTKFFNYSRCHRYVALEKMTYQRDKAIVSFDESLEDLYSKELESKKEELLHSLYDKIGFSEDDFDEDSDFDPLYDEDKLKLITLMQPQYETIESLSASKIKSLFGAVVIHSRDTFKQKYIEKEIDGFHFFAFLDAFQEDDHHVRIIETKASTSKKFHDVGYKHQKEFYSVFHEDEKGVYRLKKELNIEVNEEQYNNAIKKLFNKYEGVGKYVYDLAYQRYLHESYHIPTKKKEYYLAVLNHQYIYQGEVDLSGHQVYQADEIMRLIDLTEITRLLLPIIDDEVKQIINRLNTMQASPVPLGVHCQKGKPTRECPFLSVCLGDKNVPDKNSLFMYRNPGSPFVEYRTTKDKIKHYLYDLINEGLVNALDIPRDWLSKVQKIQYDVLNTKIPYVDHRRIQMGIKTLKYPLYHLDFETFSSPLPRYRGEKPYQQSLFQFSLHIEHENQEVVKDHNIYYLANDHSDHRERLVQKLIESIPMNQGNVIVYNRGFESGRIKELISLFPQYAKELENIRERIFDLLYLVRGNEEFYMDLGYSKEESKVPVFYHEDLQRSYSIKQVLPIFAPELNYKMLDEVQNGQQAQIAYYQLPNMTDTKKNKTYHNMLEYCKQDTWAMVLILKSLYVI